MKNTLAISFRSIALVAALLSSGAAFAHDSMTQVCSGFVQLQGQGDDKVGLSIQFYESRSGADTRHEVLSAVYQQTLFQGERKNTDTFADGKIDIKSKSGGSSLFVGSYKMTGDSENRTLVLEGKLTEDPSEAKATYSSIRASLPCMDLSN